MSILETPPAPVEVGQVAPADDPRASWPEWTSAERWATAADADGPRPTASYGHAPDPWSEAFWVGFNLGLEREAAAAPGHYTASEARAFLAGHIAGGREWERRLGEMFADRASEGRVTDADAWPTGCVS